MGSDRRDAANRHYCSALNVAVVDGVAAANAADGVADGAG